MSNTVSNLMDSKYTGYLQDNCIFASFLSIPVTVAKALFPSLLLSSEESSLQPEKISSYNISVRSVDGYILVSLPSDKDTHPDKTTTMPPPSTGDSDELECRIPDNDDDPRRYFSFWFNASPGKSTDHASTSLIKDSLCVAIADDSDADDQFFEKTMPVSGPDSIIPPISQHCFETDSMIYIHNDSEKLDIHTVDIIKGSELANQLGISGKINVDKVFYQPGTGAINAQVTINGLEQLLTLFYIKVETNIKLPVTQYQLDSYLSETKNEYAPHYKFFREELKKHLSPKVMGTDKIKDDKDNEDNKIEENKLRMKSLRITMPTYMHPKTIEQEKYFCCNQGISAVTNKEGTDVIEAVKRRMYQQEEKLVSLRGPRLEHPNIDSALEHVKQQKIALPASQRDAKNLKIHFDKPQKVTLSQRQLETVNMLNQRRLMHKKEGIDFGAPKDTPTEFPHYLLPSDSPKKLIKSFD
ncbi:hypothetical protein [Salinisphaera sp. G21_0]|uniref:hypothetical protein n=1 Tax=Salinisphaera sp. G21_0 TaxID=2821094 RepID=UPI001AD9825F|nr:hypothetical protein [Salinisphaera sp. G21_0]MBO9480245.1 hypothetical protein [Salinisphaera sp. G21_0]